MQVTPAPDSSPIIAAIQHQAREYSRGFRPAGTKDWLMITTLDGAGYVLAGQSSRPLARGDMLLVAPDTPQEYGYRDENGHWSNIWVHFRPRAHWLPWLTWPQVAKGIMILPGLERMDEIEPELRRMVDIARGPLRLRQDAAMNSLERVLILADDLNPIHAISGLDSRIKKALEIVGEQLSQPLSIESLGRAVGLSRSRFSVLFSEQLNLSPQTYIELARLARAAQMLQTSSWPVSHIAEEVGFPNAFYFSTRFRLQYGVPPSVYRTRIDARPQPAAR